jgi:hypothetical protein
VTDHPSTARALNISYFTCVLSQAKKNGSPERNSGEVTVSGLGCRSPAASSAWRRLSLLTGITSATTVAANYNRVKHCLALPMQMNELASNTP